MKQWPGIFESLCGSGKIKSSFTDFKVTEELAFKLDGRGEHLYLYIEKTDANTRFVANELARLLGCSSKDIGYAGMKDRHAVTRQWFSIYLTKAKNKNWQDLQHDNFKVIDSGFHTKKLKIGELKGNTFDITVREFDGDRACIEKTVELIKAEGFPNYFGPQRFGHNFNNWNDGKQWLRGSLRVKRNQETLLISALRSFLFNEILAMRVKRGNWNKFIAGDLLIDNQTGDYSDRVQELAKGVTSAPLFGRDRYISKDAAREIEEQAIQPYLEITELMLAKRINGDRRALVCHPQNLKLNWKDETSFQLVFTLSKGSFATSLLGQIIDLVD